MSDAVQIDFLSALDESEKPVPLYVQVQRKEKAICNELWAKHHGNVKEYVEECVDRFAKAGLPWYDLRDDDRVKYDDVVGECFFCGKSVTARDVCSVDALTYAWKRKDGRTIEAYRCYGECACREPGVFNCDDDEAFHQAYLRLTGYTDAEYIQNLKREQPSVFEARVKAGMYDADGNRLPPKQKKRKERRSPNGNQG